MKSKIIRIRKGKSGRLKPNHPWVYRSQIAKPPSSISGGDIVSAITADGKFVGRGYYNGRSEISLKILTFNDEVIDKKFFDTRIKTALEKRKNIFSVTNAARIVFSEADGLPGLIVDVYSDTAVFQVLTLGMERLKKTIVQSIKDILSPKYLYEKSESSYRKIEGLKNIKTWWGEARNAKVEIFEGRARFIVDIENGHKTGFYLDQRKSRLAMAGIAKGKKILDLFSYTGGFSVQAALSGALDVCGVDIKKEWLELARENTALNGISGKAKFTNGDAFETLKKIYNSGEKFDIIIIDPPSFVKTRDKIAAASRGYEELNFMAMKTLNDKGILATFSCSQAMSNNIFSGMLKRAAISAGKETRILKRCHQAEDHPIVKAVPETEYLKGYFLLTTKA